MSGLTLSKLTSSLMVTSGDSKTNIGLNLKFEAKSQKVLGYSRKGDSGWEFSAKAVELIKSYNAEFLEIAEALDQKNRGVFKFQFLSATAPLSLTIATRWYLDLTSASDFFPDGNGAERLRELKAWLVEKGVRDFDKVPLYSEQLEKVRPAYRFVSAACD